MEKIKLFFKAMFSLWRQNTPVVYRYAALLFLDVAAIIYFSLCSTPHKVTHFSICIFKNTTGYPCPACGTTRGLKFFFHFMPYDALMMNPLSVIVGIAMTVIIFWSVCDLVAGVPSLFNAMHSHRVPWYVVVAVAVFVVLNEIWNIQKGV